MPHSSLSSIVTSSERPSLIISTRNSFFSVPYTSPVSFPKSAYFFQCQHSPLQAMVVIHLSGLLRLLTYLLHLLPVNQTLFTLFVFVDLYHTLSLLLSAHPKSLKQCLAHSRCLTSLLDECKYGGRCVTQQVHGEELTSMRSRAGGCCGRCCYYRHEHCLAQRACTAGPAAAHAASGTRRRNAGGCPALAFSRSSWLKLKPDILRPNCGNVGVRYALVPAAAGGKAGSRHRTL